jgi:hypothetical protein
MMPRFLVLLLLAMPATALAKGDGVHARIERPKAEAEHAEHREVRIREALEHGDITPDEAAALRERRREDRRQRLERWLASPAGNDVVAGETDAEREHRRELRRQRQERLRSLSEGGDAPTP